MDEARGDGMPLAGRKALVIGAGTAAGRAAALALAGAGADVACASPSIDGEEVMATRRTKRAVEALGRRAAEYAFDLQLGQNVRVSTRQVSKELGGLDILVTASEAYLRRPAEKTSDAEWTRTLNLNLGGAFYACRSALGEMGDRGGRLVAICSALAVRGAAERAAYSAAQHGVVGLMRALAEETAGRGITANVIVLDWLHGGEDGSGVPEPGSPEALGALVVRLTSPDGADVSGEVFTLRTPGGEG